MIKIKLKALDKIKELTEVVDDEIEGSVYHTLGCKYDKDIIKPIANKEVEVIGVTNYDDTYAWFVKHPEGYNTHIQAKWVGYLRDDEGNVVKRLKSSQLKKLDGDDKLFQIKNDIVVSFTDNKLHNILEFNTCSNCGNVMVNEADGLCSKCMISNYYKVENYSYKPHPFKFVGEQLSKDAKDNPVWYGIELEYGVNDKLSVARLVKAFDRVAYLKDDASIYNGDAGSVEFVTHPMSFKYIKKVAPFSVMEKLDVVNKPEKNGCHIHVSRSAWVDDTHLALFSWLFKTLISNKDGGKWLQKLGGREFTEYCQPSIGFMSMEDCKKDKTDGDRYLAMNCQNRNTIEFRFFTSTTKAEDIYRYVEFLESLIKYTKYNKKSVSTKGWVSYVKKHKRKYNVLVKFLQENEPVNVSVYKKEPRYKIKTLQKCSMNDIRKAKEFKTEDNVWVRGVTIQGFYIDRQGNTILEYTSADNMKQTFLMKDIKEFKILIN